MIESITRLIKLDNSILQKYSILNIGGENPIDLMHYIHLIEKLLSKKAKYEFLPIQKGDVEKTVADTRELGSLIDYYPTTKVENGIKLFLDWYLNYHKV